VAKRIAKSTCTHRTVTSFSWQIVYTPFTTLEDGGAMAECSYCGKETDLYVSNVPMCVECHDDLTAGRKPPNHHDKEPEKSESTLR
jgi:hypothetical protein